MAYDRKDGPFVRQGYVLQQASGAPNWSGQIALWNQSGNLQIRVPGGQDLPVNAAEFNIPVDLASCRSGAIVVRQFPAYAGAIQRVDFQYTKIPGGTSSGKACTIQFGVGSGSASGGVVTLSYLSGATLQAQRVSATAFTGANTFTTSGEITATVATETNSSFADGAGVLTVYVQPSA